MVVNGTGSFKHIHSYRQDRTLIHDFTMELLVMHIGFLFLVQVYSRWIYDFALVGIVNFLYIVRYFVTSWIN